MVAVLATFAVMGSAPAALAQCVDGHTPTCSITKAAPVIFLGSIESKSDGTFHFRVEERFAGVKGTTIDIVGLSPIEGSNGYDESVKRYLVFADTMRFDEGSEHAYVGGCGRQMIPFRWAGPDLEQLRRQKRGRRVAAAYGILFRTMYEGSSIWEARDTGVLPGVVLRFQSDRATVTAKTRSDGTFMVERLPTGTYQIAADLPVGLKLGQTIVASATVIHLAPGQQLLNADIHLPPGRPTRKLEIVLNWNGMRVADTYRAFVTASMADSLAPYARKTADDTYTVNLLPDATYRIHATASCKQPDAIAAATDTIAVDGSDQSVARVTLTFAPGGCRSK